MGRGNVATLPRGVDPDTHGNDNERSKNAVAVEYDGFNLHAGVRIEAGDDLGRERLCRYGARPPLSLERLRRLPGGRIAYRLKYVSGGRGKHRVMSPMEFMARLSAIIAPPRFPLSRYSGVLAPRSKWRREVVPKPRDRRSACDDARGAARVDVASGSGDGPRRATQDLRPKRSGGPLSTRSPPGVDSASARAATALIAAPTIAPPPRSGEVVALSPNILSVRQWDRLMGGLLYSATPRVDWATLLRRSFAVDVLACPRCHGRLRVLAVITEREPVGRILAHLGMPADAPPVARARDPTDDTQGDDPSAQLALDLA
jgi:hypothetical protein